MNERNSQISTIQCAFEPPSPRFRTLKEMLRKHRTDVLASSDFPSASVSRKVFDVQVGMLMHSGTRRDSFHARAVPSDVTSLVWPAALSFEACDITAEKTKGRM